MNNQYYEIDNKKIYLENSHLIIEGKQRREIPLIEALWSLTILSKHRYPEVQVMLEQLGAEVLKTQVEYANRFIFRDKIVSIVSSNEPSSLNN